MTGPPRGPRAARSSIPLCNGPKVVGGCCLACWSAAVGRANAEVSAASCVSLLGDGSSLAIAGTHTLPTALTEHRSATPPPSAGTRPSTARQAETARCQPVRGPARPEDPARRRHPQPRRAPLAQRPMTPSRRLERKHRAIHPFLSDQVDPRADPLGDARTRSSRTCRAVSSSPAPRRPANAALACSEAADPAATGAGSRRPGAADTGGPGAANTGALCTALVRTVAARLTLVSPTAEPHESTSG